MDLQRWADDYDRDILDKIDSHGVAIPYVFGDDQEPPFAYTVGLAGRGHPEFVLLNHDMEPSAALLNTLATHVIAKGMRFSHGDTVHQLAEEAIARLVEVIDTSEYAGVANGIYATAPGEQVAALQVVFPDDQGRFPWHPGSAKAHRLVLGVVPSDDEGCQQWLHTDRD